MNEKRKLVTVLTIIVVVAALLTLSLIKDAKEDNAVVSSFHNAFAGADAKLIYIGRPTCGFCNLVNPTIEEFAEKYNLDYLYINSDQLSKTKLNKILDKLDVAYATFGTPYFAIVANNGVIASHPGYGPEEELFAFLQQNNLIASDAKLVLNYISYEEYENLIAANTKSLVVAVKPTYDTSINAIKVLKEISEETGLVINVLDLEELDSTSSSAFTTSLPKFTNMTVDAPIALVVQNGDLIASDNLISDTDTFKTFLTTNGFLSE